MVQTDTQFIERMEEFGVASGMPRSMARVLGYLTICEPSRQSAVDIQRHLNLSAGSVSGALTTLNRVGLIERHRVKDERRYYYELDSEGWRRATIQKIRSLRSWADLAESGLKSAPHNQRLVMMRDIYLQFDQEFAIIAKRLEN